MDIKEKNEQLNELIEKAQILIQELEKDLQKQEPEREKYLNIPKGLYFSILGKGNIDTITQLCLNYNDYIKFYNYDQTEEEAQKRADYIKAVNCAAKIYKFVQSRDDIDWSSFEEKKYSWAYDNKEQEFYLSICYACQSDSLYFSSEENAELFRKLMEKEGQFKTFMTGLNYLNDY